MKNLWFVSRQRYYYSGVNCVELSRGGLDYCNADAFAPKYPGEMKEYSDPREATEIAVAIYRAWKRDAPGANIKICYGGTGGFSMEFEPSTIKKTLAYGKKCFENLPKCDMCDGLMGKTEYSAFHDSDFRYCSEECSEKAYTDSLGE